MFKKYLRKKQYAKIKSFIKAKISLIRRDSLPEDKMIRECCIAQEVILKEVLHFIENEEGRS